MFPPECPYCQSNNVHDLGISNPFSGLYKYKCHQCKSEYFGKPIATMSLDRDEFEYGISRNRLKDCPGCGNRSAYYFGGSDMDIECANKTCKFYKPYTSTSRYSFDQDKSYSLSQQEEKMEKKEDDEDTKEISISDIDEPLGDI